MHYSVCIPAVFGKEVHKFLDEVKKSGFNHYEFWSWWDQDVEACKKAQQENSLEISALCTRFISLTDPSCRKSYVEGVRETVEVCKTLGCKTIISQVGSELSDKTRKEQHDSIVAGLKECLPIFKEADITLVIEPLNTKIDHMGYYLWQSAEAYDIVDEVGDAHVKVLFDIYHQHIMNDLDVNDIVKNIDKIGHFHMAGYPGRHEPHIDCEIDYQTVLKAIKNSGYQGSIGLEYFPVNDIGQGLNELRELFVK